jgi:hypothetical protein
LLQGDSYSPRCATLPIIKQVLWINKENYVLVYGEYFSRRDVLLKTIEVLDVSQEGTSLLYPT